MRGYFFVFKHTLPSGNKIYYYQTYKPDGTLTSSKSTGCRTKSSNPLWYFFMPVQHFYYDKLLKLLQPDFEKEPKLLLFGFLIKCPFQGFSTQAVFFSAFISSFTKSSIILLISLLLIISLNTICRCLMGT